MILREILFWCLIICVLALNVCVWKLRRELKRAKEWRRSHENTENVNAHWLRKQLEKDREAYRCLWEEFREARRLLRQVNYDRLWNTFVELRQGQSSGLYEDCVIDEAKDITKQLILTSRKLTAELLADIKKKQPIKGNTKGDKERMKAMFEKYGYTYEEKQKETTP